jgi:photosystem II stability/assembly factor-like uncharacterized protein
MSKRTVLVLGLLAAAAAVDRAPAGGAAGGAAFAQAYTASAAGPLVDAINYRDLRWRNVGPTRGGRVTAIAGVRSQPCTFYMGATGGGVWKTETCGHEWTPVTDGQIETGSIGAIDVSESNPSIVWVGTGSAAIRSNVIIGRGVYKSTDAGRTWQFMGLRDAGQIGSIAVHPSNPDVVWLAALGSPYGPNAERGIFKTTDGGRTWTKTLFVTDTTGGRALAVNYSNPNELYAGMYRAFRKGWDIISGGPATEGGVYKSTDGGSTWTRLSSGLPQKLIGKIDIDVARSNPKVVYAMIEAPGSEGGLYRSDDAGGTWRNVNRSANLRPRPFYFNYVDVNPKDEDEVWVNALGLFKSTDGGRSFTAVPTPHGDNHGIWFNPDHPQIAIQANDGGANVTIDGGRSWSSILNQSTAELYMVGVDEQYPYMLYGPQQDNSTVIVPSLPAHAWAFDHPAQAWRQASGCETGGIWPTPDGKVVWGACKGEVERYSVETGQSQGRWIYPQNRYGHHPDDIKYRFPRQTVIFLSPHNPKVIYQASHVVHRSTDDGVSWQVISPDLTAHEKQFQVVPGNPITRDVTGEEVYSSIYSAVESRLEPGVLWVGANDGPVHVSRDNGRTWKNVTPPSLPPGGRVQNIEDSPHRKGSAYIAVYRYLREHDLQPYVYATADYGATWTRLTDGINGMPDSHPTRVVREDPVREGLLYAGTEFGLFVSFDNGGWWQSLRQNLPATPVTDLRVHRGDLVISTMGRSFWIMDDVSPLRQLAAMTRPASPPDPARPRVRIGPLVSSASGGMAAGAAATVVVNRPTNAAGQGQGRPPAAEKVNLSRPVLLQPTDAIRYRHASGERDGTPPQYPPVAVALDYIIPVSFRGPLSLEIENSAGRVVRTVADGAGQGAREGGRRGAAAATDPDQPAMRGGRGRGGAARLTAEEGHNRFRWDYRWANDGPMVAPGKYTVRLKSGDRMLDAPKTFTVAVDPRVLKDGVTVTDLIEQEKFLLEVRDAVARGDALRVKLQEAMARAGVQPSPSPGPGEWTGALTHAHPLQALWARLVTAPGTYQQGMLIDQLSNIVRAEGGADQKVGREARRRFDDLMKELQAIEAEAAKYTP